jgi:hypothetical protein
MCARAWWCYLGCPSSEQQHQMRRFIVPIFLIARISRRGMKRCTTLRGTAHGARYCFHLYATMVHGCPSCCATDDGTHPDAHPDISVYGGISRGMPCFSICRSRWHATPNNSTYLVVWWWCYMSASHGGPRSAEHGTARIAAPSSHFCILRNGRNCPLYWIAQVSNRETSIGLRSPLHLGNSVILAAGGILVRPPVIGLQHGSYIVGSGSPRWCHGRCTVYLLGYCRR